MPRVRLQNERCVTLSTPLDERPTSDGRWGLSDGRERHFSTLDTAHDLHPLR